MQNKNIVLRSSDVPGTGSFANADAALAGQPENVIDPILAENLDDVSPADPLFPVGDVNFEVVKVYQAFGKDKPDGTKGGLLVKFELKTTQDYVSVTGDPIPAGRRIFTQISLKPSEKYTKEMIQRNLKRFQVCVGAVGPFYPLEQYVGTRGILKMGMKKPTDTYPDEANEVKSFVEKKKV